MAGAESYLVRSRPPARGRAAGGAEARGAEARGAPLWRQGSPSGAPERGRLGLSLLWGPGPGQGCPTICACPPGRHRLHPSGLGGLGREDRAPRPDGRRERVGAWRMLAGSGKRKPIAGLANILPLNKGGIYSQEILQAE